MSGSNAGPILCPTCRGSFENETRLRLHARTQHGITERNDVRRMLQRARILSNIENGLTRGKKIEGPVYFRRVVSLGNHSLGFTIPFEIADYLRISRGDQLIVSIMNRGEFRVRIIDKSILPLSAKNGVSVPPQVEAST
jgi:antitoxin component of MazEF toxin-antitoxin module